MNIVGCILGFLFFILLCVNGVFVNYEWKIFRNLKVGDHCCTLNNDDSILSLKEIIKVEHDENGNTIKVTTKDGTYSFLDCLRDNIRVVMYD